ncbi:MAG: hypothetical protein AAF721_05080 [Myxococcota bacterium]
MNESTDLFARDGHITMLSIDRYDAGEFDDEERRCLEGHIETCPLCRERLQAVSAPSVTLLPPAQPRHETGSVTLGYLAGSAVVAAAAMLIATVGATVWPDARVAHQASVERVGMSSAYTSVAHEYSEMARPDLEVAQRDGRLLLRADDVGTLAVVVMSTDDLEGGTGGTTRDAILDVLLATHDVARPVSIPLPTMAPELRVFAVACTEEAEFFAGEGMPSGFGCTKREIKALGVDQRDS